MLFSSQIDFNFVFSDFFLILFLFLFASAKKKVVPLIDAFGQRIKYNKIQTKIKQKEMRHVLHPDPPRVKFGQSKTTIRLVQNIFFSGYLVLFFFFFFFSSGGGYFRKI